MHIQRLQSVSTTLLSTMTLGSAHVIGRPTRPAMNVNGRLISREGIFYVLSLLLQSASTIQPTTTIKASAHVTGNLRTPATSVSGKFTSRET